MKSSVLGREVYYIQNPALCCWILWRFCKSYTKHSPDGAPVPFNLMFIVLPLILHKESNDTIQSTRKSLSAFVEKFKMSKAKKADLINSINKRVINYRPLTTEAYQLGVRSEILLFDKEACAFFAKSGMTDNQLKGSIENMKISTARLGKWCASLNASQVSTLLKVNF